MYGPNAFPKQLDISFQQCLFSNGEEWGETQPNTIASLLGVCMDLLLVSFASAALNKKNQQEGLQRVQCVGRVLNSNSMSKFIFRVPTAMKKRCQVAVQ